jgi:uncharacterized protein (DUF2141 family)
MPKISMLILSFIFAFSTSAYSQEKFTVSGEVKFPKRKGVIILTLKTQEEFEKREKAPPERRLVITPDAQQLRAEKVPFRFVDVPKGAYAISCIQDLNENGELDYMDGAFGRKVPTEPYGFSGPMLLGEGHWGNVKFEVDKDINGIEIEVRSY